MTITPAMLEGAPEFAPVPRRHIRHDGWTPERQRAFVKALADHGCVRRAAAAVGMSEVGAYQMRRVEGAEGFARAWAEAQGVGMEKLADVAIERALYGVAVPVFHKGEQVGERRWYNDRLLTWILRHGDPERFGGATGNRVPPHVRRALRAEWDAERAAEGRQCSDDLSATLEAVRRRMEADGDLAIGRRMDPSHRNMSMMQRFILWAYGEPPEDGG